MSTYQEILNQAQSLTPEEQELLLKDLALLIHQRESIKNSPQSSKLNLARWRGFLPKQLDALEFQLELREEWDAD